MCINDYHRYSTQGHDVMMRWFGVHHIGVVVDNWENAEKFYTEVMGGIKSREDEIRPAILEFLDDILDAQKDGVPWPDYGIPEIGK